MPAKLFSLRRPEGPPSTQFAPTILAMPEPDSGVGESTEVEPHLPDSQAPDSVPGEGSGAPSVTPDIVTDLASLPSDAPDPADAPTLSHIGRYALKRQLGAGGLGTVFEAWDPLLSRAVAVKTLQFDVDPGQRSALDGLFLNEARAAAGLNHRYIVTVHDAGLSAHGVYIAMERLYGRDLQRAIADGWRPGVEQTVQLIRRVNEALAYAHARGVVHCDIKPANIFLQRRDKPKVLDFGIARLIHAGPMSVLDGALVGSPRYRAPEQLRGEPVDARTDLFSLGVVMYELLTGRRAFPGETLDDINRAVLESDPPAVHLVDPSVPAELSAMVARLMSRAPAARYTCASELNADLRRWLVEHGAQRELTMPAGRALVAPTPAPATPPARSRWNAWLWGGGLVLGLAAALLAWWPAQVSTPAPRAVADNAVPVATPTAAGSLAAPAATRDDTAAPAALSASPQAAIATPPSDSTPGTGTPATGTATTPPPAPATPADTPSLPRATTSTEDTASARNPARPGADTLLGQVVEAGLVARMPDARRTDTPRPAKATAAAAIAATGVLQLAVTPWAEVEVDGQAQGAAPPLTRLTLPVGTHRITLRNGDYPPHTLQVEVTADRPVVLQHRFGS